MNHKMIGYKDNNDVCSGAGYEAWERAENEARHLGVLRDQAVLWLAENEPDLKPGTKEYADAFWLKVDELEEAEAEQYRKDHDL